MRGTLLCTLLAPVLSQAQPVLQYANVDPIGSSYAVHIVTDPGSSDPNISGANVTWDFSSATLELNQATVSYALPSATPYAASYPASNLAQVISVAGSTIYAYFELSTSQLDILAEDVGSPDPSVYSTPKTPLMFPFGYQDSFVDNYIESGVGYNVTREYTGYGTLILPTGTFTNVVKMESTSGSIDFFGSDPVEQLVNIDSDGQATVFEQIDTSVPESGRAIALVAYPNPVSDRTEVRGLRSAGTWTLTDVGGRIQRQGSYTAGTLALDLADLATGCYVLHLQGPQGSSMVKLAKQ